MRLLRKVYPFVLDGPATTNRCIVWSKFGTFSGLNCALGAFRAGTCNGRRASECQKINY